MDEARGDERRDGTWLTRRRVTFAGTALVVVGLLAVARTIDLGAVVDEIAGADPRMLGGAVAVYLLSWPLRGRRYADVLGAMGHRGGTAFLTGAVFASQTANLAIPARAGDAVRAYLVHAHRNVPYTTGAASLAVERAFDLLAVTALAAVSVAWLAATGRSGLMTVGETTAVRAAVAVGGLAAVAAVGVGVVVRSDRRFGAALRARTAGHPAIGRAVAAVLRFGGDLAAVAGSGRALVAIGAGSLLVWLCDAFAAVLVVGALDIGLDVGTLLAVGTLAVSVGNLAKVVPLSQGGVGLYEAAFTALVVGLTPVGASTALSAAIVDHALKNLLTLVGGGVSIATLDVSLSAAARERPAATPDAES